jgi:hypothetical protein
MYRFGWKQENKIYYYSEFLGRGDKIDDEDMITSQDRTKYELEIKNMKKIMMKFMKGEIVYDDNEEVFYEGKSKLPVVSLN